MSPTSQTAKEKLQAVLTADRRDNSSEPSQSRCPSPDNINCVDLSFQIETIGLSQHATLLEDRKSRTKWTIRTAGAVMAALRA